MRKLLSFITGNQIPPLAEAGPTPVEELYQLIEKEIEVFNENSGAMEYFGEHISKLKQAVDKFHEVSNAAVKIADRNEKIKETHLDRLRDVYNLIRDCYYFSSYDLTSIVEHLQSDIEQLISDVKQTTDAFSLIVKGNYTYDEYQHLMIVLPRK